MPIRGALLAELQAALGAAVTPSLTPASAHSDIFEGYVFGIVLTAAKDEGATVTYQNIDGSAPGLFTFRTSPGYIFSSAHPYTYAIISFPEKPILEAHVGIRVEGKSGVLHECDVAVLDAIEAAACRANQTSPRSARVLLGAECKFYASDLPLGMVRAFLGLAADMSFRGRYLVVNTGSKSGERLLSHRDEGWEHQLVPGSSTVPRLHAQFREVFKYFKARRQ